MAKGHGWSRSGYRGPSRFQNRVYGAAQRDLSRIASDDFLDQDFVDLRSLPEPFYFNRSLVRSMAPDIEDHRLFEPEPVRTFARQTSTRPARTVASASSSSGVRFSSPRHVLVCFRRKLRKEVLHALGRTGAGGKRNKRLRKRTVNSGVHC